MSLTRWSIKSLRNCKSYAKRRTQLCVEYHNYKILCLAHSNSVLIESGSTYLCVGQGNFRRSALLFAVALLACIQQTINLLLKLQYRRENLVNPKLPFKVIVRTIYVIVLLELMLTNS